jgi:hypothetical protein
LISHAAVFETCSAFETGFDLGADFTLLGEDEEETGVGSLETGGWPDLGGFLEKILENNAVSTTWIQNGDQHNKKNRWPVQALALLMLF